MLGGRASSILKHFDLFSFVGGGPVSKSRCKMFKYFHKGFQYLNFFGGTSQKKHPVGAQELRKPTPLASPTPHPNLQGPEEENHFPRGKLRDAAPAQ